MAARRADRAQQRLVLVGDGVPGVLLGALAARGARYSSHQLRVAEQALELRASGRPRPRVPEK